MTDSEARECLERIRWPEGVVCPKYGDTERAKTLEGDAHREGLYKCYSCRKQFTITVGTVMHRSKIPLRKWVMAFQMVCASKKGISALQLQRMLDLGSYRTAWHMAHGTRLAMQEKPMAGMLAGTVEVDETYVGGKGKRPGRGTTEAPVVALVERGRRIRSHAGADVTGKTLKGAIREVVGCSTRIVTDGWGAYRGIGGEFDGGHETVNHGRKEYVRGDVYTNTAENYFAQLKRGLHGAFHRVSKKHLGCYCDEFAFRWNHRHVTDGDRTEAATRDADGKRPLPGLMVCRKQNTEPMAHYRETIARGDPS